MAYKFRGNLCGYLCENYSESLAGVTVLLYLPWQTERITQTAVASTKDTFRLVSEQEQRERAQLLVGKAVADAQGNFEIAVEEQYANTAFDVDFVCGSVPHKPPKPKQQEVQFHLTTVYPQWRAARQEESTYYFQ